MTEEADLTTQRLKVLTRELDELRSSSLNLNGEPDYGALADAPGLRVKPLIHAYLHSLPGEPALFPATRPICYSEVPVPPRKWRTSWLVTSLLDQWGDLEWDKRESSYDKLCHWKTLCKLRRWNC